MTATLDAPETATSPAAGAVRRILEQAERDASGRGRQGRALVAYEAGRAIARQLGVRVQTVASMQAERLLSDDDTDIDSAVRSIVSVWS